MNSINFPQSTLIFVNRVALEVFEAGKEHNWKINCTLLGHH
jgi:hypothetical protein